MRVRVHIKKKYSRSGDKNDLILWGTSPFLFAIRRETQRKVGPEARKVSAGPSFVFDFENTGCGR